METLTLEQMYYIGELIGVVAIITSLIYVGKQVRQNTKQMETNSALAQVQWSNNIQSVLLSNRDGAECWVKGGTDLRSLDEVDQQRIIQFEIGAIVMISQSFEMWQQNLLPDERWKINVHVFSHLAKRESIREAWNITKDGFSKPFRDYMRQYLE